MPGIVTFDQFQGYRLLCLNENCEKTFKSEATRQYHMKHICNRPPRFKCAYCGHTSDFSKDIKRHSESKHPGMLANILELFDPGLKTNFFDCPSLSCGKKFKYERNLVAHIKHECGKPPKFRCYYCNFRNHFKHVANQHSLRKHPLEKVRIIEEETANFNC